MTPLNRLGKKTRLLDELIARFPQDRSLTFVDLFMGSGEVSFTMAARGHYVIANDIDDDVYNLFMVIKDRREELLERMAVTPYHESVFNNWKLQQEEDCVWRAIRLLWLSNFSLLGKGNTCRFDTHKNGRADLISRIEELNLDRIRFMNAPFQDVLPKITSKLSLFVYADPPYVGHSHNYQQGFSEQDADELLNILMAANCSFALSAYEGNYIHERAVLWGLHVSRLKELQALVSRETEILITNYPCIQQAELFA